MFGLPGYASEHYVLYSNGPEDVRTDIIMRLEVLYDEYQRQMCDVFTPSDAKGKVFFIGDKDEFVRAGGYPNAPGIFRAIDDEVGPRLLVRDPGNALYIHIAQLMQHEGWHQFNWDHVRQYSPIWLDEGLATYFQYGMWTGDMMIYGGLLPDYFNILADGISKQHLRPLGDLMALDDGAWQYWQSIDGFWAPYMQSWSVIQFLKYADGGAHKHLLDAYIADVAAGADTSASVAAIAAMQDRWSQWLMSIGPTSTHGRFFEAIAAMLAGHLARAQINGQTFESMDAFLAAVDNAELQLGPVGSPTWLPPTVMSECKQMIAYFSKFYAHYGLGTLELELENVEGVPTARVMVRDCGIDIRATAEIVDGKVAGVQITHLQPLPQRFE